MLFAHPQPSSKESTFRPDINGLRAWAVSFVILYHFGVPGFGGGFVGVDVFFVISGFLMTGIITRGLERGNFSLGSFYFARATRIVPALIALCAFLLAAGWWFLPPPEYLMLGTHSAFTLAFLSNIKFWLEAGYFDAASHEKWLLHTWSLAVEWQFYLLLPLALMLAWKLRPRLSTLSAATLIGLLASLSLSIALTQSHPSAAFYLLPTRAWEMLSGGLMYFLSVRFSRGNPVLERTGLALIIASVLLFDSTTVWPGWQAMLPVAGTMLVLHARQPNSLWTGNRIAQWLGTCSYSLYLWHWPVVVTLFYVQENQNTTAVELSLLITAIAGTLSYKLIEAPGKKILYSISNKNSTLAIIGLTTSIASCGAFISLNNGIYFRLPKKVEIASNEYKNTPRPPDSCSEDTKTKRLLCTYGKGQLKAIVIGDSHAHMLITAISSVFGNDSGSVLELTHVSCPTVYGIQRKDYGPDHKCSEFNEWATKKIISIDKNIPLIIINRTTAYVHGRYGSEKIEKDPIAMEFQDIHNMDEKHFEAEYERRITETACNLAKKRHVYMMRPIPEMGSDIPKTVSRLVAMNLNSDVRISLSDYRERHKIALTAQDNAAKNCNVTILNPIPYLCDENYCFGSKQGQPFYIDDNHLSETGSHFLIPMLKKSITERDAPSS